MRQSLVLSWVFALLFVSGSFVKIGKVYADEAAVEVVEDVDEDFEDEEDIDIDDIEEGEEDEGDFLEVDVEEEGEGAREPSPDVIVSSIFPDFAGLDITIGERVTVLCGFTNTGSQEFTVGDIRGFLVLPQDFSYYLQNYTAWNVNTTVGPNEQFTFAYSFSPSPLLDPRELGITLTVDYESAAGNFSSAFFNQTVNFVEKSEPYDFKKFFLYLSGVAAVGLVLALSVRVKEAAATTSDLAPVLGTTSKKDIDAEWIHGTNTATHIKRAKTPSPLRRRGKSPKSSRK